MYRIENDSNTVIDSNRLSRSYYLVCILDVYGLLFTPAGREVRVGRIKSSIGYEREKELFLSYFFGVGLTDRNFYGETLEYTKFYDSEMFFKDHESALMYAYSMYGTRRAEYRRFDDNHMKNHSFDDRYYTKVDDTFLGHGKKENTLRIVIVPVKIGNVLGTCKIEWDVSFDTTLRYPVIFARDIKSKFSFNPRLVVDVF